MSNYKEELDSPPERELYEEQNKPSDKDTEEFLNYWGKDENIK